MSLRFLFLLALNLFFRLSVQSQIVVTPATADQLAQFLMPPSCQVSNAYFSGAVGKFTGGYGLSSHGLISSGTGVVLTTGSILPQTGPNGPNDDSGLGVELESVSTLPSQVNEWLIQEIDSAAFYDPSYLYFEFTSTEGGVVSFQYIFGSEEYHKFVNSQYKDVFAIFVEGQPVPKVRNLALVPASDTPISVNTINNGYTSDCTSNGTNAMNPQFFVDNCNGLDLQYNGFTKALEATMSILPFHPYRIWFVICDVQDSNFDSGVLIKYRPADMSMTDNTQSNTNLYPNPSNGHITLSNLTQQTQVTVYDMAGQPVYQQTLTQTGNAEINLEHLAAGVYTLVRRNDNGVNSSKIILQK